MPIPHSYLYDIEELFRHDIYSQFASTKTGKIYSYTKGLPCEVRQPVLSDGYLQVWVGKNYRSTRFIWECIHGPIPEGHVVDHKYDQTITNNNIDNLHCVPVIQNSRNRKKHKNNRLGVKGVCKKRNGYQATIRSDNKQEYLGLYQTIEEAQKAYDDRAKQLGFRDNLGNPNYN